MRSVRLLVCAPGHSHWHFPVFFKGLVGHQPTIVGSCVAHHATAERRHRSWKGAFPWPRSHMDPAAYNRRWLLFGNRKLALVF